MPELRWTVGAVSDLTRIFDYIADENPDAAQALLQDIRDRVQQLADQPRSGRIGRVAGTRELVVKSNYIVVYIEDTAFVDLIRVLHAARRWP